MKLLSFIKETLTDALRLARSPSKGLKSLYGVSLYRNAVYLRLASGTTAVLGFVFWVPWGLRPECPGRCPEACEKAKIAVSESYVLYRRSKVRKSYVLGLFERFVETLGDLAEIGGD